MIDDDLRCQIDEYFKLLWTGGELEVITVAFNELWRFLENNGYKVVKDE